MATRTEANTVYAAGLVQGIVLVTFPAASTIFTDPAQYDLSSTQYGTMFLPQLVTAITASLLGGTLARRLGTKRVYLVGLLANMASMALLIVSEFVAGDPIAYGLLLAATACLGWAGPHRARAEHPDRGVPPGGGRHVGAHPQCVAGARDRARARVRRDLCGSRVLVGLAGAVGRPADGPARGELAAAVAVGRARGRRAGRGGGSRDPGSLLALRRVRRPLRHPRDHERQLGAA
jgi:hypothetical protein